MEIKITVAIQSAGILFLSVLFILVSRNFKSSALRYWSAAWTTLSLSLICFLGGYTLFYDFDYKTAGKIFFLFYNFGEYVFLFLLVTGCRNFSSDYIPSGKSWLILIPALLAALVLSFVDDTPQNPVYYHGAILSFGFFSSFYALNSLKQSKQRNLGLDTMRFSLLLLGINFAILSFPWGSILPFFLASMWAQYKTSESVLDLIVEIFLGFGMIMAMLERMHGVEKINKELEISHNRLEQEATIDPLTTVLNRHAFHNFLYKQGQSEADVKGCAGIFDVNNLKPINDNFGHKAGDAAIRAVAHSIRNMIRADDLLFRWGGDEFLLIMPGFDEKDAQNRLSKLNEMLKNVSLPGLNDPIALVTSYGFAGFSKISELEKAIEVADLMMYRDKQIRKSAERFGSNPASDTQEIHTSAEHIN